MSKVSWLGWVLAISLGLYSTLSFRWHTNSWPFQGDSIAGLPDNHIRAMDMRPGYFDLLFHRYGGVYFNYFGETVYVYVAYYIARCNRYERQANTY